MEGCTLFGFVAFSSPTCIVLSLHVLFNVLEIRALPWHSMNFLFFCNDRYLPSRFPAFSRFRLPMVAVARKCWRHYITEFVVNLKININLIRDGFVTHNRVVHKVSSRNNVHSGSIVNTCRISNFTSCGDTFAECLTF